MQHYQAISDRLRSEQDGRQVVVLGHNSAAFSLLAALTLEPLRSQATLFTQARNITLVLQDFWLDSVDSDRIATRWGQLIVEYPYWIRMKLNELFPEYPEDKCITFDMFRALRAVVISDLTELGVGVIKANTIEAREHTIRVDGAAPIRLTERALVINTLHEKRNLDIDLPIQTELYKLPMYDIPDDVVVIGFGASAVWVQEQTPQHDVLFGVRGIQRSMEKLEESLLTSRNQAVNIGRHQLFDAPSSSLLTVNRILRLRDEHPQKQAVLAYFECRGMPTSRDDYPDNYVAVFSKASVNTDKPELLILGKAYNAAGFKARLFQGLSADVEVLRIHARAGHPAHTTRNIPAGALMDRFGDQVAHYTGLSNNLGSPMDCLACIPFEILQFQPEHVRGLTDHMKEYGVELSEAYWAALGDKIEKTDIESTDPLKLMIATFNEINPNKPEHTRLLTQTLDTLFQARQDNAAQRMKDFPATMRPAMGVRCDIQDPPIYLPRAPSTARVGEVYISHMKAKRFRASVCQRMQDEHIQLYDGEEFFNALENLARNPHPAVDNLDSLLRQAFLNAHPSQGSQRELFMDVIRQSFPAKSWQDAGCPALVRYLAAVPRTPARLLASMRSRERQPRSVQPVPAAKASFSRENFCARMEKNFIQLRDGEKFFTELEQLVSRSESGYHDKVSLEEVFVQAFDRAHSVQSRRKRPTFRAVLRELFATLSVVDLKGIVDKKSSAEASRTFISKGPR